MLLIFKVWITSFRQRTKGSTCLKRYWKLWKSTNMFSRAKFLMHASCQDSCQYSRSSDCSIRFVVSCCCLFEQVADMENTGTAFPSFMATWAHVLYYKSPSIIYSNFPCQKTVMTEAMLFACLLVCLLFWLSFPFSLKTRSPLPKKKKKNEWASLCVKPATSFAIIRPWPNGLPSSRK